MGGGLMGNVGSAYRIGTPYMYRLMHPHAKGWMHVCGCVCVTVCIF